MGIVGKKMRFQETFAGTSRLTQEFVLNANLKENRDSISTAIL